MKKITEKAGKILAVLVLGGAMFSVPLVAFSAAPSNTQADKDSAAAVKSRLSKKQYSNVQVTMNNGIATLKGTVDLYIYKSDAEKTVLHTKGVTAVRNEIEVAGPSISDAELQKKLVSKLTYDQIGFGHVFDAISANVQNGVVTLGGHVHNYVNRNSALALVATMPGVKDVVDNIEVDPASPMDDQIRIATARAVYGFMSLNKYAIDPAKPIRISVQNGHVELYGVVDSQADKDAAYIQANSVPGVFSVTNYLQVAGQPSEQQK